MTATGYLTVGVVAVSILLAWAWRKYQQMHREHVVAYINIDNAMHGFVEAGAWDGTTPMDAEALLYNLIVRWVNSGQADAVTASIAAKLWLYSLTNDREYYEAATGEAKERRAYCPPRNYWRERHGGTGPAPENR